METNQIITLIFSIIIGMLAAFFLLPGFIYLCEDLGGIFIEGLSGLKNRFIETAKEWKNIFKRTEVKDNDAN